MEGSRTLEQDSHSKAAHVTSLSTMPHAAQGETHVRRDPRAVGASRHRNRGRDLIYLRRAGCRTVAASQLPSSVGPLACGLLGGVFGAYLYGCAHSRRLGAALKELSTVRQEVQQLKAQRYSEEYTNLPREIRSESMSTIGSPNVSKRGSDMSAGGLFVRVASACTPRSSSQSEQRNTHMNANI